MTVLQRFRSPYDFWLAMPRDYWHVREPPGAWFQDPKKRGYYLDMRAKTRPFRGPESEGFPLLSKPEGSTSLLPVTVSQQGLGWYERWIENPTDASLSEVVRCADWLVANAHAEGSARPGWLYPYSIVRLGIRGPFISGMGQGEGISLLIRAHLASRREEYLETAERALEPFLHSVPDRGVTVEFAPGVLYFEEYPSVPPSLVLNGHIFALWGLLDYADYTGDEAVRRLYDQGVAGLEHVLQRYDLGVWTRYDLYPEDRPNWASPLYQEVHIDQLRVMHALTGIPAFRAAADRWEEQFRSWENFGRMLFNKVRFRLWQRRLIRNSRQTGPGDRNS